MPSLFVVLLMQFMSRSPVLRKTKLLLLLLLAGAGCAAVLSLSLVCSGCARRQGVRRLCLVVVILKHEQEQC